MGPLDTLLRRLGQRLVRWGESLLARAKAARAEHGAASAADALDAKALWEQRVAEVPLGAWQRLDTNAPRVAAAAPAIQAPPRPPVWPGNNRRPAHGSVKGGDSTRSTAYQQPAAWLRAVAARDAGAARDGLSFPSGAPASGPRSSRPSWTWVTRLARHAMRYLVSVLAPALMRRVPAFLARAAAIERVVPRTWPGRLRRAPNGHRVSRHDPRHGARHDSAIPSRRSSSQHPAESSPAPRRPRTPFSGPNHSPAPARPSQTQAWTPPQPRDGDVPPMRWPAAHPAPAAMAGAQVAAPPPDVPATEHGTPWPNALAAPAANPQPTTRLMAWPGLSPSRAVFAPGDEASTPELRWPELPPWPEAGSAAAPAERVADAQRLRRLEREHATPDPRRSGRD